MVIPRLPDRITLVAAVKYLDKTQIQSLVNTGINNIGFNTVQQLAEVSPILNKDTRIHFIGHLQKNKVKKLLNSRPYLIQSCDSYKLIEKINSISKEVGIIQNILLQIKTDEKKEHGFSPLQIDEEVQKIAQLPNVRVMGLMTIPPHSENEETKEIFKEMKIKFDNIQKKFVRGFDYLSMGMSSDYNLAILEGANMIRLGRILSANPKS